MDAWIKYQWKSVHLTYAYLTPIDSKFLFHYSFSVLPWNSARRQNILLSKFCCYWLDGRRLGSNDHNYFCSYLIVFIYFFGVVKQQESGLYACVSVS